MIQQQKRNTHTHKDEGKNNTSATTATAATAAAVVAAVNIIHIKYLVQYKRKHETIFSV